MTSYTTDKNREQMFLTPRRMLKAFHASHKKIQYEEIRFELEECLVRLQRLMNNKEELIKDIKKDGFTIDKPIDLNKEFELITSLRSFREINQLLNELGIVYRLDFRKSSVLGVSKSYYVCKLDKYNFVIRVIEVMYADSYPDYVIRKVEIMTFWE